MNNEPAKQTDFFGLTKGLSGTQIKIIGVIMMVFDHLYQMFYINGVPQWFTWIGRPVAPIFLFICAEGFIHTRSRKRYLLHLLIGFEFMSIVSLVLPLALPNNNIALIFSIFGSLFFAALYMLFIEMLHNGIKTKKPGKAALSIVLMLIPAVYGSMTVSMLLSPEEITVPQWAIAIIFKFIPNIMTVEGGILWALIGSLFYVLRNNRLLQIIPLAVFGFMFFILGNIEWLIILAVIPILLYNDSRGKGGKYFFYIFYPAHIYLFYIIAYFVR
ncbi:MAG: conjugal transfer protein TraX [Treponema sp.]|nr:conjugal transfer protein TraX [Treponema sp.]